MSTANKYQIRFLDRVVVKGKTKAIAVYEVLDAEVEKFANSKLKPNQILKKH
jgi:hypothetical protein